MCVCVSVVTCYLLAEHLLFLPSPPPSSNNGFTENLFCPWSQWKESQRAKLEQLEKQGQ